ncbi:DNA replication and repair protein RecF [Lentibacillus kapialis]|uniref:DNA replication and repair protein RecF n=1 Tax=Lentibacillus kapialis TaxID=340214 RepID=A0A917PRW6_9BACI|nr:DNA replication/repair protein RecF [Lentibacillus kapialis]GGJ89532.1 DNA replication and repair protein RecF [Lentibacillus kapialis]
MNIEQLQLKNYRNYEKVDISFNDKINVIIGENAQGKTNVMEAIYVLAFSKSHRTPREKELIKWEQEYAKIEGRITKRNQTIPLEIILSAKGKKAKLNHIEQRKLSDYIGAFNVVMFAPEHLSLVKGSPQTRRRFIDMELGQIQPTYIYHLGQYQKILKQRNHLLKQLQRREVQDKTMLDILTDQLIQHAVILLERRFIFLDLLRKWTSPVHHSISHGTERLEISYIPTVEVSKSADKETIENIYTNKFHELKNKEIERGTTLIGPHRDDIVFYVNDKDVQTYGSQGQQRTAALSVKLAEIELICNEVGEYPVLLLDDVLSELDDQRQSHLLNTIKGKVQTFVSTTNVNGINHETLQEAQLYRVENGMIET